MRRIPCLYGHSLQNGDGKLTAWIFRTDDAVQYVKNNPGYRLPWHGRHGYQENLFYNQQKRVLFCWYCKKCQGLSIKNARHLYLYQRIRSCRYVDRETVFTWEEYIALDWKEHKDFLEFTQGMNPVEALENYSFKYKYRVSPDKKKIYAIDAKGRIAFGYECKHHVISRLMNESHDSFHFSIQPLQYAILTNGKTVRIEKVLKNGVLYQGRDVTDPNAPKITIKDKKIEEVRDSLETGPLHFPIRKAVWISLQNKWQKIKKKVEQFRKSVFRVWIYCSVSVDNIDGTYYYLAKSNQYAVGDYVWVFFGRDWKRKYGRIEAIHRYSSRKVPYPLEKMKQIVQKCTAEEMEKIFAEKLAIEK